MTSTCSQCDGMLCMQCVKILDAKLELIPWLAKQLQINITRQAKQAPPFREGGKSSETPLAFDDNASEAYWVLQQTLVTWGADLAVKIAQRPAQPGLGGLAAWMRYNRFWLAKFPEHRQMLDEIGDAVELGMRAIDQRVRKIYLADCGCGRKIVADPHADSHTCECGVISMVQPLRKANQEQGRSVYVTASEAARYLGEVYRVKVSRKTITMWYRRGKLKRYGSYYRVGEILNVAKDMAK